MQDNDGPQSLPAIALDERISQRSKPRAEPEGQAAVKQVAKKSIYKQIAQSIQEEEHHQPKTKEPREYKDYIANPAKINRFVGSLNICFYKKGFLCFFLSFSVRPE
jgi:hypothetical protein